MIQTLMYLSEFTLGPCMCCGPSLPAPSPVSEFYLLCYGSISSVQLCSSVLTVLLMSVTEDHYGALLTSHPPFSRPTVPSAFLK